MGYLRLLRGRRILLLWVAQTVSVLGDRMYALAVMWLVWETTGSAAWMGLVAVTESVPYVLLGLFGGRLLARCGGLGSLAAVDAARMVAVAVLPVVWATRGPSLPLLLIVAAALGVAGALFDPTMGALVPDMVPADQVQQVTGLMDLMGRIARIAGPAAAGVLLTVVTEVQLYLIDAATFAVSAIALAVLAVLAVLARGTSSPGQKVSVPQGPRRRPRARTLVRARPVTGCMIGLHGGGQLLLGVMLVLPALLAARGGAGAQTYAAAVTATGVGAVAANTVAGHWRRSVVFPSAYCLAWGAYGLVLVATGAAAATWQIVALSAVAGAVGPFAAVGLRTHLGGFERDERAAWMTLDQTALRAAGTVGTLLLPVLAARHPAAGFAACGVGMIVVAVSAWGATVALRRRVVTASPAPVAEPSQP
ncbi:MFS transporter [Actinomadura syzygii]|uniref:MFS transporter n=1 Tax=Actinomadura syzygii TaxID=1427538 RepID=A0A5D0TSE2_9ACTN|nr:MFS transporter [Actinomadura syzygii]TYC08633.1 MFS transporter [Actinomadura syzygii]